MNIKQSYVIHNTLHIVHSTVLPLPLMTLIFGVEAYVSTLFGRSTFLATNFTWLGCLERMFKVIN